VFPRLEARDLQGRAVELPEGIEGERNVVIVAFRRDQQSLVDSWLPWLEARAATDPGLRFYELPVIGTLWSPARGMIDGGMAAAIREPVVLQRTLTIYTDVRRVTVGLGIDATDTVSLFVVGADGAVHWRGCGGFDRDTATEMAQVLATMVAGIAVEALHPVQQFDFEFERRFRPMLAVVGVFSSTAHVTIGDSELVAHFGPWSCETTLDNIIDVQTTGPYQARRAIGPRGSMTDRGLTFGSTTAGGVSLRFREPVHGLDPFGAIAHPGLTVTVADREGFAAAVRTAAGLLD